MKLATPIGLLQETGVIGEILRQLPRGVLDEAEQQRDMWSWLARWVKDDHRPSGFLKAFEAAASQRKALIVLGQVARDGGSISSHNWHLRILAAEKGGDGKKADYWTNRHLASILQTARGRQWLLEDNVKGLSAPPKMRKWAQSKYDAFYAADRRRLGKRKADEKWKRANPLGFKMESNSDKIAEAMTTGWLTVGDNGFPGLCFMSDELLARLLGHTLPLPSLLSNGGWKFVRTVRERIGLKKAEILFTGIKRVGDEKWAILDRRGNKTHWISLATPLPPFL